jgi:DNA ligase-1
LSKGVYVSPKLDGYRCLAVCAGGSVTLYSRKGTEYLNFPGVEEDLKRSFSCDVVLDGEIMSDDFQAMQKSAFANTRGTVVGDVKFHVFDFIPYSEWISGNFKMKKSDRLTLLEKMNKVLKYKKSIELVEQNKANTLEEIQGSQLKFEQQGYEGAMVIPADSPYYKGRKSNMLLKFKSMQSQDCLVTGFYEGTTGTRNQGRLGGLILQQENGQICECGTGFTDEDREYIYKNRSEFVGKVAEIKYQELTKDGIMRFPVFVRWRNDK